MGGKLKTELPIFKEKLDNENDVLVQSRKSDLTEVIEAGDNQRDNGLSGYAQVVKGFLFLKSGEQYEAAKKIEPTFVGLQTLAPDVAGQTDGCDEEFH